MRRSGWLNLVLGGALAVGAGSARAQGPGPGGPRGEGHPPFGGPMELMGFEGMHGGKLGERRAVLRDLHFGNHANFAGWHRYPSHFAGRVVSR